MSGIDKLKAVQLISEATELSDYNLHGIFVNMQKCYESRIMDFNCSNSFWVSVYIGDAILDGNDMDKLKQSFGLFNDIDVDAINFGLGYNTIEVVIIL